MPSLNQIDVIELGYVITICRKFFAAQFTNFKVDLKEDKQMRPLIF